MVINKQRWYWIMQLSGWALFAALQIVAAILASGRVGVQNQRVIFLVYESMLCLGVSHVFRNIIVSWRWLSLGFPRLIPRVIPSVFLLGVSMYVLRMPVSIALGMFKPEIVFDPFTLLSGTFFYAIIFFLWATLYFIYTYVERYNTSLKYQASLKDIELNNLKAQLNPHFIFNALNSIRALVDENPEKSKQAINQLSNILRSSLSRDKGLTRFEDELKIVKDYLGLEIIRFEERLQVEYNIAAESNDFLVPSLMIQTLVENGVKHGISKLTKGGLIQLTTIQNADELHIRIRSSGHYTNNTKAKAGLGLANTRQRLKLLYGEAAHFEITNEKDNFVRAELIIPNRPNTK